MTPTTMIKESLGRTSKVITVEAALKLCDSEFERLVHQATDLNEKDMLNVVTRFDREVFEKIRAKDGDNHERTIFYDHVRKIMYYALMAEENINFWKDLAIRARLEADFARQNAAIYYDELMKYKTVEQLTLSGKLDDYIKEVTKKNSK